MFHPELCTEHDCDSNPGILSFHDDQFYLLDPVDYWIVASCSLSGTVDDEAMFHPELCTEWESLIDGSLTAETATDNTLTVTGGTECALHRKCSEDAIAPDMLCMTKNSVMHSFLEGQYVATGNVGDTFGTKEYKAIGMDHDDMEVWLWWYGEVNEEYPWWILSSHDIHAGDQQNYSLVYGYTACSNANPAECYGDWNFFWRGTAGGSWHNDPEFAMLEGQCAPITTEQHSYGQEYDFLCIDVEGN